MYIFSSTKLSTVAMPVSPSAFAASAVDISFTDRSSADKTNRKMNMKNMIGASLLLAISLNASAASTADLGVTGSITPGACTPSVSGGGVFDYGDISADLFNNADRVRLAFKRLDFNITCTAPTLLSLIAVGENSDSISSDIRSSYEGFYTNAARGKNALIGLGRTAGGKRIGAAAPSFAVRSVTDQGNPVGGISSNYNAPWISDMQGQLNTDGTRALSYAAPGNLTPVAVSDVKVALGVSTMINATGVDSDGLTFDDVIDFEGRLAIELVYL